MPNRVYAVGIGLLGLLGLGVVAWLVLRRQDVRRAAETGPRWRRTLVSAALGLLAAVGVTAPTACCYAPMPIQDPEKIGFWDFRGQMDDLRKWTDLLEREMAASGRTLSPEALQVALTAAEARLAEIEGQWASKPMTNDQHTQFRREIDDTRRRLHEQHAEAQLRLGQCALETVASAAIKDTPPADADALLERADGSVDVLADLASSEMLTDETRELAGDRSGRLMEGSKKLAGVQPSCYLPAQQVGPRDIAAHQAEFVRNRLQLLILIRDGRELAPEVVQVAVSNLSLHADLLNKMREDESLTAEDREEFGKLLAEVREQLGEATPDAESAAEKEAELRKAIRDGDRDGGKVPPPSCYRPVVPMPIDRRDDTQDGEK